MDWDVSRRHHVHTEGDDHHNLPSNGFRWLLAGVKDDSTENLTGGRLHGRGVFTPVLPIIPLSIWI
jgi:hypothetical protein